jgi:hypothetical protein
MGVGELVDCSREPPVEVVVRFDSDLYRRLETHCLTASRTLQAEIVEAVGAHLEGSKARAARDFRGCP